jgi:hypothetical protein
MKKKGRAVMAVKEFVAAATAAASTPSVLAKGSAVGAAGWVSGWVFDSQTLAIAGLAVTVLTFFTNIIFLWLKNTRENKKLAMEKAEHKAVMAKTYGVSPVDTI